MSKHEVIRKRLDVDNCRLERWRSFRRRQKAPRTGSVSPLLPTRSGVLLCVSLPPVNVFRNDCLALAGRDADQTLRCVRYDFSNCLRGVTRTRQTKCRHNPARSKSDIQEASLEKESPLDSVPLNGSRGVDQRNRLCPTALPHTKYTNHSCLQLEHALIRVSASRPASESRSRLWYLDESA